MEIFSASEQNRLCIVILVSGPNVLEIVKRWPGLTNMTHKSFPVQLAFFLGEPNCQSFSCTKRGTMLTESDLFSDLASFTEYIKAK
jgi:hypothetical protein